MKSFKGPKTQNEVMNDDKLMWESFVSREDSEDTGRIPHDVDSFGTSTDQSNDFMNDQELLNPLHKAAQATGADDIVDYMIKQIKDQGDNWIAWFIDTVIGDEEDYDESTDDPVDEAQGMRQRDASKGTSGAYRSAQGKELQAQQRRQALAKKAPKRGPKKHGPFTVNP